MQLSVFKYDWKMTIALIDRFFNQACRTSKADAYQLKFPQACSCAVQRLSIGDAVCGGA
jgi:hypothetical protein